MIPSISSCARNAPTAGGERSERRWRTTRIASRQRRARSGAGSSAASWHARWPADTRATRAPVTGRGCERPGRTCGRGTGRREVAMHSLSHAIQSRGEPETPAPPEKTLNTRGKKRRTARRNGLFSRGKPRRRNIENKEQNKRGQTKCQKWYTQSCRSWYIIYLPFAWTVCPDFFWGAFVGIGLLSQGTMGDGVSTHQYRKKAEGEGLDQWKTTKKQGCHWLPFTP